MENPLKFPVSAALTPAHDETAMRVSAKVSDLGISPTIAMSSRAAQLRAEGHDIINLAVGEPDFDTPPFIIDAADRAARSGFTRYTAADGSPQIKRAVIEKYRREYEMEFATKQVHVASGAKQVIYNAFAATLDPGDEVVIFSPAWVSYIDVVEFCGGTAVVIPTRFEEGFQPSVAALAAAITPRTRWVLFNTPCNPTGAVYARETLIGLLGEIRRHPQILVMSDEIYEHLTYDGITHEPLAKIAPDLAGRVLTISGVSKSYAMTGWRIGFAVGPEWLVSAMAKVQSQTASSSNSPAQAAAAEALTGDQRLVSEWRMIMQRRRDLALGILRECPGLKMVTPQGAFYIFLNVGSFLGLRTPSGNKVVNDAAVTEYLLDAAGVAMVPGVAFAMEPYVRMSFALDETRIVEACRRIVAALGRLQH